MVMLQIAPAEIVVRKARLHPTISLLNFRLRKYGLQPLAALWKTPQGTFFQSPSKGQRVALAGETVGERRHMY